MISNTIQKEIIGAMKAKDAVRVTTLKLLSAALHNAKIDKKREDLTTEEELVVVKKEVKKRQDAVEIYQKAKEKKRIEQEIKELEILQEFLPKQMSDKELAKLVEGAISEVSASSISDMGRVIGAVMAKAKGRADGKKVSEMAKGKLT